MTACLNESLATFITFDLAKYSIFPNPITAIGIIVVNSAP
jgi:hypothetical protein